jgi:hypothetical protein
VLDIIAIAHLKDINASAKLIITGSSQDSWEICAMIIMALIAMVIILMEKAIGVKIRPLYIIILTLKNEFLYI